MQPRHTRIAGAVAALIAAGSVANALRPGSQQSRALAERQTAVEVRTQVIRRTIHVVKHESAPHGPPQQTANAQASPTTVSRAASPLRTTASSHAAVTHPAVSGTAPVTTRTSGHPTSAATH